MAYFIITFSSLLLCFYSYRFRKTNDLLLLLPLFYNFVVLYTFFGVFVYRYAIEVPFDLYNLVSNDDLYEGALAFILSSFFFFLGCSCVRVKLRKNIFVNKIGMEIKRQKLLVFAIIGVYILYVFGYGIEALLYRRSYIDPSFERNKYILIIFFVNSKFRDFASDGFNLHIGAPTKAAKGMTIS
mgnify:CR=1 FL=1